MKTVETKEVLITPELALEMLKINTRNRRLDLSRVLLYSEQMLNGTWKFNGVPIIISEGNHLLDGQNRLAAIVKSKKEQKIIIVRNIDASTFDTIDVGKNRTSGDMLHIIGAKDSTNIAANINSYKVLKNGTNTFNNSVRNIKLPKHEIVKEYENDIEFWSKISLQSNRCNKKLRLLTAGLIGGYMAYLIKEKKHKEEKVMSFFNQLFFDINVENITIRTLREKLLKDVTGQYKMTPKYKNAVIIMSWNAYIKGSEIKRLSFDIEKDIMPELI
jgi:hypothetical protein